MPHMCTGSSEQSPCAVGHSSLGYDDRVLTTISPSSYSSPDAEEECAEECSNKATCTGFEVRGFAYSLASEEHSKCIMWDPIQSLLFVSCSQEIRALQSSAFASALAFLVLVSG